MSAPQTIRSSTKLSVFFFFQAEDGIRDFHVTGVQTCALPIWPGWNVRPAEPRDAPRISEIYNEGIEDGQATLETRPRTPRSEERRVGKEWSTRWAPWP